MKKWSKWSYGQIEWNFDTTAGNKFVKGKDFFPHVPKWQKNRFFPEILFFSIKKKRSCGHIECCFDVPVDFFEETPIDFVQSTTLTKQKETEKFFSREDSFLQKVLGEKDCSFDKPNEKFSTKRPIVLAQCPKMQNAKTGLLTFSEDVFSIKIFLWTSRKQCQLARRKFLWKGQNVVAQSTTVTKQLKNFSFPIHQIFLWTRENEVLTPRPSFSWRKAEVFFCQLSECHKKKCKFFEKIIKMVLWTDRMKIWHNRS